MPLELDRRSATKILHSLVESGQPPKWGANFLNVGTESILEGLRTKYLEEFLKAYEGEDGGGTCKWIEANYGNGKTHFLRCLQEQSWSLNYVVAFVELSQAECPLDRQDLVYGAVARSIQACPLEPSDVDRGRGLDMALQQLFDRKFAGVLTGLPDDNLREQALAWIRGTLSTTPVEVTAFGRVTCSYLLGLLTSDTDRIDAARTYLRGEPLTAAQLSALEVRDKLDRSNGFRFLRSLCQFIQRSELATGTLLLFDEARRSLSLMSSRAKATACENLLSVINACNNGDLPGTMFTYAVMPEFFTTFATSYPALQQRCSSSTRVKLEELEGVSELELLIRMGRKISEIFRLTDAQLVDDGLLESSLERIALEVHSRTLIGTGTRRTFVSTWIRHLQDVAARGALSLTEADAKALIAAATNTIEESEAAEVASEGE